MINLTDKTRVVLIGGSSHTGKSTLGRALAIKLGWDYRSTDKLARHPGRPWVNNQAQSIPEHVVYHYETLSIDALLLDVLSHYKKNVLPQIEAIVQAYISNLSRECLVLEGSALYPQLIEHLVTEKSVLGIWLTASDRLLQNRILSESNFYDVSIHEQYLIQKFLARTLLFNRCITKDLERLKFISINVDSKLAVNELVERCMKLIEPFKTA